MTTAPLALSIVVPTFNELGNVEELRRRIAAVLAGVRWELIFVDDDSPDGTAECVQRLAREDMRVRCLHRIGRRGLASACIDGFLASAAPLVAVIDGDLQHDERLLPRMLDALRDPAIDVVVGSRYVEGGGTGDWDRRRAHVSRVATRLARSVVGCELADPLSGFFMMRREAAVRSIRAGMSGVGFKILLDLFASAPRPLAHVELPYRFRSREHGVSKLDAAVAWEFALMLIARALHNAIPVRFVSFAIVGLAGLVVHMFALALGFRGLGLSFVAAQTIATGSALTFNFALNNELTYRDRRLRGVSWLAGWASFAVACGIGAVANVGIADQLVRRDAPWAASALVGVLIGAVWNYAATSLYTWRSPSARALERLAVRRSTHA